MTEEAKEARRKYKREWQRANPDKCRQYQETYWRKKSEEYRKAVTEAAEQQTPQDVTD